MEITLLIREKSWKYHGILVLNFCGNPVFSPQLILQFYRGCPMVISKKTTIFKGLRGGPTFCRGGGVQLFPGGGGVQMLISIKTHITCDFPGGGGSGPPIPPLDRHMVSLSKTH